MKYHTYKRAGERGITVFIAMVITAALLVISTGIVTLAVREAKLANTSKESQYAFYAADSGIECALYWDQKYTGNSSHSAFLDPSATIKCDNQSIAITPSGGVTEFTISDVSPGTADYCADVKVTKGSQTTIESRGRNTCDTSNPRRVERALKVTY